MSFHPSAAPQRRRSIRPSRSPWLIAVAMGLACTGLGLRASAIGPSLSDPLATLPSRGGKGNQPPYGRALAALEEAQNGLAEIEAKIESGTLSPKHLLEVGRAHVAAQQAQRWGYRLQFWAEPAGYDIAHRARLIDERIRKIQERMRANVEVELRLRRGIPVLEREAVKRSKQLKKVEQLCQQGNWSRADDELTHHLDTLETMACWYDDDHRNHVLRFFLKLEQQINKEILRPIHDEAKAELASLRSDPRPKMTELLALAKAAGNSVRTSGGATLNGADLPGPQAVLALVGMWGEVQLAALRERALAWTMSQLPDPVSLATLPADDAVALEKDYDEFANSFAAELVQLVRADAANATAGDCRDRYLAYLGVLGQVSPLIAATPLLKDVEPALTELAAKSPEFAQEVSAYRRATSPLLKWRARVSQAQVQVRLGNYPPLDQKVRQDLQPTGDPNLMLRVPVSVTMSKLAESLSDQKVSVSDVVATSEPTGSAISRLDRRMFAKLPLTDVGHATSLLRVELLVHEEAPPLSLEAALAIFSADQNWFTHAGGEVTSAEFGSLTARFEFIGPTDWGLVRLGPLPKETDKEFARLLVVSAELRPAWVAHQYFVVDY